MSGNNFGLKNDSEVPQFNIELLLELINKARPILNLEPLEDLPKGLRNDCEKCPIATALEAFVDENCIWWWDNSTTEKIAKVWEVSTIEIDDLGGIAILLPEIVSGFVCIFDSGHFDKYLSIEN